MKFISSCLLFVSLFLQNGWADSPALIDRYLSNAYKFGFPTKIELSSKQFGIMRMRITNQGQKTLYTGFELSEAFSKLFQETHNIHEDFRFIDLIDHDPSSIPKTMLKPYLPDYTLAVIDQEFIIVSGKRIILLKEGPNSIIEASLDPEDFPIFRLYWSDALRNSRGPGHKADQVLGNLLSNQPVNTFAVTHLSETQIKILDAFLRFNMTSNDWKMEIYKEEDLTKVTIRRNERDNCYFRNCREHIYGHYEGIGTTFSQAWSNLFSTYRAIEVDRIAKELDDASSGQAIKTKLSSKNN